MKTLIIHAGGAKTGSSALQNYLELNADQLEQQGFSYNNLCGILSEYQITSGNGAALYEALLSNQSVNDSLTELIESYFGEQSKAICSSEHLSMLDSSQWMILVEACSQLEVELHVIFYVREPISYLLSGYDQAIKAHGEYHSFDEWAKCAIWVHAKALTYISQVLPLSSITVLDYNSCRNRLIESFFEAIGFQLNENIKVRTRTVNRSLTPDERKVLCMANEILGEKYSSEIFKLFIAARPEVATEFSPLSTKTYQYLLTQHRDDIRWVNKIFFKNLEVIKINFPEESFSNTSLTDGHKEIEVSAKDCPNKILALWAIRKLSETESDSSIIRRIIHIAKINRLTAHDSIPADFDIVRYMILNTDVLWGSNNPIQHFIDHGRSEGRIYKIPGENLT